MESQPKVTKVPQGTKPTKSNVSTSDPDNKGKDTTERSNKTPTVKTPGK